MSFKLEPWPTEFADPMEFFWFGNFEMTEKNIWEIQGFFKNPSGGFSELHLPIGSLPYLRLGAYYRNGVIDPAHITGEIEQVTFPEDRDIKPQIITGHQVPSRLRALGPAQDLMDQRVFLFLIDKWNYFIPCSEIIRSLLCPFRFLANRILRPEGFQDLLVEFTIENGELDILFSKDIPNEILNDFNAVKHLIWILFDEKAATLRHSIYHSYLTNRQKMKQSKDRTLYLPSTKPPIYGGETWIYRQQTWGNNTLILELNAIDKISPPFRKIRYGSPNFRKTELDSQPSKPRTKEIPTGNLPVNLFIEGEKPAGKKPVKTVQKAGGFRINFSTPIELEAVKDKIRQRHTGEPDDPPSAKKAVRSEPPHLPTVEDQNWGAQGTPLDFVDVKQFKGNWPSDLLPFLDMLKTVLLLQPEWEIRARPEVSSKKKKRSQNDQENRIFALAIIGIRGTDMCYLIEFAEFLGEHPFTLVLQPIPGSPDDFENVVIRKQLLETMAQNDFHWDMQYMKYQKYFRHSFLNLLPNQSPLDWAKRVAGKVEKFLDM